ncbi:MAG: twin-arginine translocation signal domain-containing protein [Bdellovibrionia bacterium]
MNKQVGRRDFIKGAGLATLSVFVVSAAKAQDVLFGEESLLIRSGRGRLFEHYHNLELPYKYLSNPPAGGVALYTTKTAWHFHKVPLTQVQLTAIAEGQKVTVADTVRDHLYVIQIKS